MLDQLSNVYRYEVVEILSLNSKTSQIILCPQQAHSMIPYEPGHYVHFLLPDAVISPLSIACAPQANRHLEFHLYHPSYNAKANQLLELTKQNQSVELAGPFGSCTLRLFSLKKPVIFLAWGSGIAPVKAFIEGLQQQHCRLPLELFWVLPDQSELYLDSLLRLWTQQLDFRFKLLHSRAEAQTVVLQQQKNLSDYQVYAAGPKVLVHAAYAAFLAAGLPSECFYSDMK